MLRSRSTQACGEFNTDGNVELTSELLISWDIKRVKVASRPGHWENRATLRIQVLKHARTAAVEALTADRSMLIETLRRDFFNFMAKGWKLRCRPGKDNRRTARARRCG